MYCLTKIIRLAVLTLSTMILPSCAKQINVQGNSLNPQLISEIKENQISKEEVLELLGSPSTTSKLGGETWIYMNAKRETWAWTEPDIKARQVLVLRFDKSGFLVKKEEMSLEDGKNITPIERSTPTHGSEFGFFDQIIGNFRRFTKK